MPDCCDRLERTFDTKAAEKDLRDYLRDGPDPTTQLLIDHLADDIKAAATEFGGAASTWPKKYGL